MFVGHFAPALLATRATPRWPLAALASATVLLDVVDGLAGGLGFPGAVGVSTHTVAGALGWSVLAAATAAWARGGKAGLLFGGLALSHLLGDWVTSVLPWWPGGAGVGLGLYASRGADFAVEAGLVTAAWVAYLGGLAPAQRLRWPPLALLGVLLLLQAVFDFATDIGVAAT